MKPLQPPQIPWFDPNEDVDDYTDRMQRYEREYEAYEIECDRRVDEQLERDFDRNKHADSGHATGGNCG